MNHGRVHIRKQGGRWLVKRYVAGRVYVIHVAANFDGIRSYMELRRQDW